MAKTKSSSRSKAAKRELINTGTDKRYVRRSRGGQFKDWIHAVSVSPDGRWLAAGDMAGQVQIWALVPTAGK